MMCDNAAWTSGTIKGTLAGRGNRCPVGQSGFPENVMQVILHGAGRDAEPVRDLLVAESSSNQLCNLSLALRESVEPRIR